MNSSYVWWMVFCALGQKNSGLLCSKWKRCNLPQWVHREQEKPNDFILTPKPMAADHILPWQLQTPEALVEKNYNKQKRKRVLFASVFSRNCAEWHWSLYSPVRVNKARLLCEQPPLHQGSWSETPPHTGSCQCCRVWALCQSPAGPQCPLG